MQNYSSVEERLNAQSEVGYLHELPHLGMAQVHPGRGGERKKEPEDGKECFEILSSGHDTTVTVMNS